MQALINLLEAVRFLSDHAPDAKDSQGIPLLSVGTKAVSILLREGKEENQRILVAALLFPYFPSHLPAGKITEVFGQRLTDWVMAAGDEQILEIKPLQRLVPQAERALAEGARKVRMACAIAQMIYTSDPEKQSEIAGEVQSFAHSVEALYPTFQAAMQG